MTDSRSKPSPARAIASHAGVAAAAAIIVFFVYGRAAHQDADLVSVDRILNQMVVESEDERTALQLILTGDHDKVVQGTHILEKAALLGRPTAQRHLATYWALSESSDRRSRVYQWLLIALACARGIDRATGADTQINYIMFLTNIALIEQSTPDLDKERGRQWAKGWFEANSQAPGLSMCDVVAIDDYRGN